MPWSNREAAAFYHITKLPYKAQEPLGGRPMTDAFQRYRELEKKLIYTRWIYQGLESDEENLILDEMEEAWWHLTDDEKQLLNKEIPTSLIRPGSSVFSHHPLCDVDVWISPGGPYRTWGEVA